MSTTSPDTASHSADTPVVSLEIAGMSCGHCVAAVQSALETVSGVRGSQVAVGSARLVIDPVGTPEVITAMAVEAIRDAGYDARIGSGTPRSSTGPAPRSAGLPVMGSCCSPRRS